MNYIAIYKISSTTIEDSSAKLLLNKYPNARKTSDGKHLVFCDVIKDPISPFIFEPEVETEDQVQVIDWLSLEDSEYPLWITYNQLKDMDALELLGPIEQI